jgi:hypothetical protein
LDELLQAAVTITMAATAASFFHFPWIMDIPPIFRGSMLSLQLTV